MPNLQGWPPLVAKLLGGIDNGPQPFNPYTLLRRVTIAKGTPQ